MAQKAIISTAFELDEITLNKIKDYFTKKEEQQLDFIIQIDKDLIGGFVVTIGDKVYDASALASIKAFKAQVANS